MIATPINDALIQIAKAVAEPAGLQLSAMPPSAIQQALHRRQHDTGFSQPARYREHLQRTPGEQERLLEELLVHESFFFRDSGAFAEMRRWCLEWLSTHEGMLRVLSAPCATGEEPYSISAMLWMAGVAPERYLIDAVDISAPALEHAEAGMYGSFSLRGLPRGVVPEFLDETANGLRVRSEVSSRVRFRRLNLVEVGNEGARALTASGPYELICSRNLLLYQTSAAKLRLVERLRAVLAPDGRLVIGAADWCSELAESFDLAGPAEAFALRARSAEPVHSAPAVQTGSSGSVAVTQPEPLIAWEQPLAASDPVVAVLAEDAQRFAEHEESAEQVESLYVNSQRAWESGSWEQAEKLCRQALYLDSAHLPSLELLRSIWAPRMPERFRRALEARIERHARGGSLVEGQRV